jgi:hypothetical protein
MDEPEDVIEDLGVVGVMLEAHELDIDYFDALIRLGQEFPQQVVHGTDFQRAARAPCAFANGRQCVGKPFNFGCAASAFRQALIRC